MKSRAERLADRQILLEDVAKKGEEPIIVNGALGCDESQGVFVTSAGKFVRFNLGEVRRKRIELGLEEEHEI